MILLFCTALHVILVSGSSLSDLVSQTPAYMYKNLGEEAVISCSHSIKDYTRILWYKQMKDGQLQFLGYMLATQENPEPGLGVKMDGDANINKNCTLTVEGLSSSLSDNVQQTPAYMYKNLGEEAVISCSHSIENYDRILWYKQMKDGELQFLGYILKGFKNPEPGLG
ncbi:T cell receptor beta variable 18 [Dissostichus eleginoides]|nr:T cell receptor beta variable 18 [Dissostichus eleginoides]